MYNTVRIPHIEHTLSMLTGLEGSAVSGVTGMLKYCSHTARRMSVHHIAHSGKPSDPRGPHHERVDQQPFLSQGITLKALWYNQCESRPWHLKCRCVTASGLCQAVLKQLATNTEFSNNLCHPRGWVGPTLTTAAYMPAR
jgi:hypothetical protein